LAFAVASRHERPLSERPAESSGHLRAPGAANDNPTIGIAMIAGRY